MGSTIVCAVDWDDDGSPEPLRVAADLAARLDRPLVVAHVAPMGPYGPGGAVVAPAPAMPYPYPITPDVGELEEARGEARRRVEQLLADCGIEDAEVEVVLDTTPADGLRRVAKDRDAELLIVGSHGRGLFRAALAGDTSHALVGEAPCPIVVVPAPK